MSGGQAADTLVCVCTWHYLTCLLFLLSLLLPSNVTPFAGSPPLEPQPRGSSSQAVSGCISAGR